MDQRHREQLSTPLVTSTLILIRFIVDKAQQARRIVRWEFISPILKEARLLFVNIGNMIDGVDCKNEALQNLYSIQKQTVMVCYLEKVYFVIKKEHYICRMHKIYIPRIEQKIFLKNIIQKI